MAVDYFIAFFLGLKFMPAPKLTANGTGLGVVGFW
jgi:hypothetical protein